MSSLPLTDLQDIVGHWHLARWGAPDQPFMAAKLAEEVGEVCEAAVKVVQGHPRADEMDYGAELADVVIVALASAHLSGVDLGQLVEDRVDRLAPAALRAARDLRVTS